MDLSICQDTETTEFLSNVKRSFNSLIEQDHKNCNLRDVKKDLRFSEDQTPKPSKLRKLQGYSISTSPSDLTTPVLRGAEKMKQELSLKEADIITLEASIVKWEKQVSKMESDAKEAEIHHDKEIAKIKAAYDREVVKSSEMYSKLQYLMEKEKLARQELEDLRKDSDRHKVEMDKKILSIQREKLEEGDKVHQLRSQWLEKECSLREEVMALKSENNLLKINFEEAEAQLNLRKRIQQDNDDQNIQTKHLMAELQEEKKKYQELSKILSDHEDNITITKAMKKDLDLVPSMKSQLEKFKMDNEELRHNEQNTLLLEEELRSVKSKLEEALSGCEKFTELEVANEDLQSRLQRWEASDSSGSRRPQSPSSLSRRINELETSQAMMLLQQGDIQTNLNREKVKLENVSSEKSKLSLDICAEKRTVQQQNDLIKRLKRKLLLTSQARDSYKSVLDSYESEATVNVDAESQRRIQKLDEIMKGYQNQIEENEAQLIALEEKLSVSQMSYDKIYQQFQVLQASGGGIGHLSNKQEIDSIRELKEQIVVLENSLLKVQTERDVLEARIEQRQLQGDYDPSKTKIIHLISNPISEAEATRKELVKKLTSENDTLRKRNEILESSEGRVDDLTIQVNDRLQQPSPTKELEAMKQELKRQETRNQRLMEVFTKTSREFREICYQLTGYRIDIPCSNQYRLSNLYSTSPNDYLWFQQSEAGEIQMLKTDFSSSLTELMEQYLQKEHSIPLFLSQVTMDLYSKQTLIP